MEKIIETQSNNHGNFNGNRGDHNIFGKDNVVGGTHTHHYTTNIGVINQGETLGARDGGSRDASRPYWIVPYSRNRTFTGRNSTIEAVNGYCRSSDHNRIALHGLGGSGKTQIALEYVYQRAKESECDVFWVNGSGLLKFSQGFRTIAQRVYIPRATAETNEEGFLSNMKAWFEGLDSGDWILVIDNADNEVDFQSNESPIAKFVPQGQKGTVIFTTRSRQVASRQECTAIEVGKMSGEEALELFSKRFRGWDGSGDEERKVVPMILDSLDHVPLAVVGAAAFMTETQTPPSNYWSIFQDNDKGRTTLLLQNFGDIRQEGDMTKGILGTYFITFDRITKQMPTAAGLLRLIAFFDRENIPERLLSQCGFEGDDGSVNFRLAIGKLLGFSLVTDVRHGGKRFYELHRLVQLSIRAYLSTEELLQLKATALRAVSQCFPQDEFEWRYGGTAAAYVPHALSVAKDSTDPIAEELTFWMGKYFLDTGSYSEAETQARRCIALRDAGKNDDWKGEYCERVLLLARVSKSRGRPTEAEGPLRKELSNIENPFAPECPTTLACVETLASVLRDLGRYDESEKIFRCAFESKQKAHGPNHPDTLTTADNLALVLQDLGRYDESETMFSCTLKSKEKVLGPDHPSTLTSVNNLAVVLRDLGRYVESERLFRYALDSKEKILGPNHPGTLTSVNNLALVQRDLGRYAESERMFLRVLESAEKVLGPDHPDTLTCISNLASVIQDLGRYGESETMFRCALEGRQKVLGPNHPGTLTSVNNLALVLRDLGRYGESESMFRRVLESAEKDLGPDHPDALTSVNNLALVLQDLGRYDESERMFSCTLESKEKVLGPDHPSTLTSVNNLAVVLRDLGRYGESGGMFQRALESREEVLGSDHPDTLKSVNNLALVLRAVGRYGESEMMFQRALKSREKVLGPDHPGTLTSVNNLALVLRDLGRYGESESMFRRVLESAEKDLGPDHPSTLASVNNLAMVVQDLGRYAESETMHRRALESRDEVLGPDHPDTLTSVNNLASVVQDLGRYGESETMFWRALEGRQNVLGQHHPDTLTSANNLASVLRDLGRYAESETMHRRALESKEKVLGPAHPSTLASVNNLALVLRDLRRYSESETMFRLVLEGTQKVLRPDHPDTLETVHNLASVLQDLGRYDESEILYWRALETRVSTPGPEHYKVCKILARLAGLHEKAEEAYQLASKGFFETLGRKHPTTLECIWKLTALREKISAIGRINFVEAYEVVDVINRRRHFAGLRRRKGIDVMTLGKQL